MVGTRPAGRREILQRAQRDETLKRAWQRGEGSRVDLALAGAGANNPIGRLAGRGVHPLRRIAHELGLVGEDVHNGRVEARREQRQELGADAIARDRDVLVRLVLDEGNVPPGKRGYARSSSRRQSSSGRTIAPLRGCMPASPRKPAPRVRRSRNVSAWSSRVWPSATTSACASIRARSRNSWRDARGWTFPDRAPLAGCACRDVAAIRDQRTAERRRHVRHKSLVGIRRGAELMVEVGEADEMEIAGGIECG